MLELGSGKKNKINLSDYDCQQDIQHRMLIADLSFFEHQVLQEIFFSPLKFPLKKLCKTLDCEEETLNPIIAKFKQAHLLSVVEDQILVDKEMRKYFEFHLKRFESDFKPDMEYLQGILRKVPIHVLPTWYAIPRTSNNIFESIVEKYLFSPQIFQRYLGELSFTNPVTHEIIQQVFSAPDYRVSSSDLITKYNLSRQEFEEILLLLEFSFICCLTYTKGEDIWIEWVTPFHEWHEYLQFLKETEAPSISANETIEPLRDTDFAFVEDLGTLLTFLQTSPTEIETSPQIYSLLRLSSSSGKKYIERLMKKLLQLHLVEQKGGKLLLQEQAFEFLKMDGEKRAVFLYRHPYNSIEGTSGMGGDKQVRELEKSVRRVLHQGWVFFDDFVKGALVSIGEEGAVHLKRIGKHWKYVLPTYTDKQKELLKFTILDYLFEVGMTIPATCQGKPCFKMTPFGKFFFEE